MLTPDAVKPLLSHPDFTVREAALDYFHESYSDDPDVITMVLGQFDEWDTRGKRRLIYGLRGSTLTETSARLLIERIEAETDRDMVERLNNLIADAPVSLLPLLEQASEAAVNVERLNLEVVRHRAELEGHPAEELWGRLLAMAQDAEEEDADEFDWEESDQLIEVLTPRDQPEAAAILRRIRGEIADEAGYLRTMAIELTGRRGITEAIPDLVRNLGNDSFDLGETVEEALIRMRDPGVARAIVEWYPDAGGPSPGFVYHTLENIKFPEAEEAVLSLLETETDEEARTFGCMALCSLFSERGIPVILRQIEAGYADDITTLEEQLLPVATALGVELPEAERWRAEAEERQRVMDAVMEEWDLPSADTQEYDPPPPPPSFETIRRDSPRIGRNEPCPCGSGKKFKKCCGANV
jgi:hypothetical protein